MYIPETIYWPLIADYSLVAVGALLCFGVRSIAIFHPLPIYLFFHVIVVSGRMTAINNGQISLFTLARADYEKALLVADLCLSGMILGSAVVSLLWSSELKSQAWRSGFPPETNLPLGRFQLCVLIFGPVGVFSVALHIADLGGGSIPRAAAFNLINAALLWPALLLLIFIAYRGPSVLSIIPLATLALLYALQGNQRFRVVVLALLVLMVFAARSGRTGFRKREVGAATLVALMYFPMDAIGTLIQRGGASASEFYEAVTKANLDALSYRSSDQMIFDHLAAVVFRVDQLGVRLSGLPYLLITTLPIPRAIWPDKPTTAIGIDAISNPAFPLEEIGATTTLPGDLYLNFGLYLVPVAALFIGLVFSWAFYRSGGGSVAAKLLYLGFAAVLIQVYRDGLVSAVVFLLVHMMPLTVFCLLARFGNKSGESNARNLTTSGDGVPKLNSSGRTNQVTH